MKKFFVLLAMPALLLACGIILTACGGKSTIQLTSPVLIFDDATDTIYFAAVANASGYEFLINNTALTPTFNSTKKRYEHPAPDEFTAKVTALGKTTKKHIFTNSNQTRLTYGTTYATIETLVESIAYNIALESLLEEFSLSIVCAKRIQKLHHD